MKEYNFGDPLLYKLADFNNLTSIFTAASGGLVRRFLSSHISVLWLTPHAQHIDLNSCENAIRDSRTLPGKLRFFICPANLLRYFA